MLIATAIFKCNLPFPLIYVSKQFRREIRVCHFCCHGFHYHVTIRPYPIFPRPHSHAPKTFIATFFYLPFPPFPAGAVFSSLFPVGRNFPERLYPLPCYHLWWRRRDHGKTCRRIIFANLHLWIKIDPRGIIPEPSHFLPHFLHSLLPPTLFILFLVTSRKAPVLRCQFYLVFKN